jgi:pyruvate,water dikinase
MWVSNLEGDEKVIGNKAKNLSKLLGKFEIPKSIVITTKLYEYIINSIGIQNIKAAFTNTEMAQKVKSEVMSLKLPENFKEEINNKIKTLKPPYAIRSSSTAEDTDLSFAGLFDSFLYVGEGELENKIKEVIASVFNERVIDYITKNKFSSMPKMAVLIQEMISNAKYGVMFGFNEKGKDVLVIESGIGDPAVVTSGRDKNDIYYVDDNEITKYNKLLEVETLFKYELDLLIGAKSIIKGIEFPFDVEWAIKNDKLYILQLRKLTAELPFVSKRSNFGIPAAGGNVIGRAKVLNSNFKSDITVDKGDIIVAPEIWIEKINIVKNAGGICLEVPGILNHAAILAREYGIPCVVGLSDITKKVKEGEKMYIDGDTGEIRLLEREGIDLTYKPEILRVDFEKLKPYWFGKHFVLLYQMNGLILFSLIGEETNSIKPLLRKLCKEVKKPILNGGIDEWYDYACILEMSNIDKSIFNRALVARNVAMLDEDTIPKIKMYLLELLKNVVENYKIAFGFYNSFKLTNKVDELSDAFIFSEKANAYMDIIKLLSGKFIEDKIKESKITDNEALELQQNKEIIKVRDDLYSLIDEFILLGKSIGVDKKDYTSILAYIREIRNILKTKAKQKIV